MLELQHWRSFCWAAPKTCWGTIWVLFGYSLGYIWVILGTIGLYLGTVWFVFRHNLGFIWVIFGHNLVCIWAQFELYLGTIWVIFDTIWVLFGHNLGYIWYNLGCICLFGGFAGFKTLPKIPWQALPPQIPALAGGNSRQRQRFPGFSNCSSLEGEDHEVIKWKGMADLTRSLFHGMQPGPALPGVQLLRGWVFHGPRALVELPAWTWLNWGPSTGIDFLYLKIQGSAWKSPRKDCWDEKPQLPSSKHEFNTQIL